ncbi:hypothetical protein ACGVWS_12145 [Enterobacteriaceae bacterium LUAb1]
MHRRRQDRPFRRFSYNAQAPGDKGSYLSAFTSDTEKAGLAVALFSGGIQGNINAVATDGSRRRNRLIVQVTFQADGRTGIHPVPFAPVGNAVIAPERHRLP